MSKLKDKAQVAANAVPNEKIQQISVTPATKANPTGPAIDKGTPGRNM